ncbi:inositol phosphorylceramide synthase [Streptomyces sp. NBRC 14336]|uniref:phosphatase PAP2 family protein n=1 Tax=Streptomyces sp. NBRC 14336 TaxID=3030992 RepID=UPI0024A4C6E3|nr:phosphatase PAP2 family protein [Streptomyces sp. NBRC 14336]GLW45407.1 inositol phosphorylceramide synthase [Streptomyces sp. NBRC 14336]
MPHAESPGTTAAPRGRLRWWTELPLILLVYACYSGGRLLARGDVASAVDHGLTILRVEKLLYLNAEHPLNRLFTREPWLGVPADFWYASLHYLVTPLVLVWIFRSHAVRYRVARTWLMTSTFIGLIGFTLLPTCPPRLLAPTHGFVDTMAYYSSYGWWGGEASAPKGLGGLTNQYAAMPSLHCGWALWCGVMLWRFGGNRITKIAAVIYPVVTIIVVMGTANHYFLDAVAGVAVMGAGLLLTPYVLRAADLVRARFDGRGTLVAAHSAQGAGESTPATKASIVSGGCQTSAGERFPRQRESRFEPGAEPGASPTDAGDGAPAKAR